MDLSLATNTPHEEQEQPCIITIEKEPMFEKVVTPSDVGKLNRLVIPKQHAEKYFPLDSSANEKGLHLNFEDRNGKAWRFRYSYWNSSQSYVMTKGWSRFVKEKKLDPGDIVSFQRGVGESGRNRLFIDWRRKPNVPGPTSVVHFNGIFPRFYSFHQSASAPRNYEQLQGFNHGVYSYNGNYNCHQAQAPALMGYAYGGMVEGCYVRSPERIPMVVDQVVIDSVPVVQGRAAHQPVVEAAGKRLRLFGVNMECGGSSTNYSTEDESSSSGSMPRGTVGSFSSSSCSLQLRLPSSEESLTMQADDHQLITTKKGKSSLSFDLDL